MISLSIFDYVFVAARLFGSKSFVGAWTGRHFAKPSLATPGFRTNHTWIMTKRYGGLLTFGLNWQRISLVNCCFMQPCVAGARTTASIGI